MALTAGEHSSAPRGTSVCPESPLCHFLTRVFQVPHSFPTLYSTSSSVTFSITSCQQILEKIVAKREFPQFLPLNLKLDLHPHCCVLFPQLQRKVSLSSKAASSVRALDHILSYVLEDFFIDCLLSLYLTSSIQIC